VAEARELGGVVIGKREGMEGLDVSSVVLPDEVGAHLQPSVVGPSAGLRRSVLELDVALGHCGGSERLNRGLRLGQARSEGPSGGYGC